MVVMSIEKYDDLLKKIEENKVLETKFGTDNIGKSLEEAEIETKNENTKYYTHEEMLEITRRIIDEQ